MAEITYSPDKTDKAGSTNFDTNLKRIYQKKSLRDLILDLSTYSDSYIYKDRLLTTKA